VITYFHSIILGIVEGLTEFLPISSTGHLMIAGSLLGLEQTEFLKTFEISIQLGAILSVVVLYWRKLLVNFEIMKRVAVAFVPTAVVGLAFYKIIKNYFLESVNLVCVSLFIGGVVLVWFEKWYSKKPPIVESQSLETMSYKQSFYIGLIQSISIIPGVSRAGATIVGGLSLGLSRKNIVEFSFLLAVPVMLAATGLDALKNYEEILSGNPAILAVGFVTSFIVAILAIKYFIAFIKKNSFTVFGVYRIIAAVLFWLMTR
jgi:undecaprenyl-diphosphatase